MDTFWSGAAIAFFSGITYLAFNKHHHYAKLWPILFSALLLVFIGGAIYANGFLYGFLAGKDAEKSDFSVGAFPFDGEYALLVIAGCAAYLILLAGVPYLLGYSMEDTKAGNPQKDETKRKTHKTE